MRIQRLWPTDVRVKINWPIGWQLAALIGLFCSFAPHLLQAQNVCVNPTNKGAFTLDKSRVCVGEAVNIINVPPTLTNVGYFQQYNGNGFPATTTLSTSFTYAQPGSYTIIQVGSGNGSGSGTIFCQEVTVLQNNSIKVAAVKTCSARKVEITLDPATLGQYDAYVIRWNDGSLPEVKTRTEASAPIAHTYTANSANTNRVTVYGVYGSAPNFTCEGPRSDSQSFTLSTTAGAAPTVTRLTASNDNTITLQYQAASGTLVELLQKDANGIYAQTYQRGTGSGIFTVSANTRQTQCFRLAAQDACNTTGAQSDEVCTLVLNAEAVDKQNNLSWEAYAGTVTGNQFRYYRVLRSGTPFGGTLTNRNTTTYADNNRIECGVQYCYSLEATIAGAAQTVVTSAPICVTGINGEAPGDFRNIVVSVEDGRPRLVATIPTAGTSSSYTMTVSRADGTSGNFQPIGTVVNRNTFIDETANPSAGSYCYQLTYQNRCGLTSNPSPPVCTIFLSSKSSSGIDWTADSPFSTGPATNYTVEVIDSVNNTKQEINLGSNTHYEPDPNDPNLQSQKYRIIAVSSGGIPSYSNFYTFRREAKILAPDAFTPNGDGMNDTFVIRGVYADQFRLTIYDRWGTVLYSTTDKTDGWNGTVGGQASLAGQYMYRVEITDLTGQKTVRTGGLLLIR